MPKSAKEKRRNSATLHSLYADKNEGTLFPRPVIVGFLYAFAVADMIFKSVSLIVSSMVSS